jgi:hypothetical protein
MEAGSTFDIGIAASIKVFTASAGEIFVLNCPIKPAAIVAKAKRPEARLRRPRFARKGRHGGVPEDRHRFFRLECKPSMVDLARKIAFIFNQAALEKKAGLIEGAGDGGA